MNSPIGTKKRLVLTTTEASVLGLLCLQDEASGYDLHRQAQRGVAYIWTPARSRLYNALPRLVDLGLAEARPVKQETRPDKVLYRPTDAGRAALADWLAADEPWSPDAFLLRLYFGGRGLAGNARLVQLVERFRDEQRSAADEYASLEGEVIRTHGSNDRHHALRYGIALSRMRVQWAEDTLERLRGETS